MQQLTRRGAMGGLGGLGAAVLGASGGGERAAAQGPAGEGGVWPPWARPGPYLSGAGFDGFDAVRAESFGARQRVALTYFFYWYDSAFMRANRGRTDTYRFSPTNHEMMTFRDPAWYVKEFVD